MADSSLQEYRRKQQERWRQQNNLPPLQQPEVIQIPSSPVQAAQQQIKQTHDHILSDEEMAKKLQQEFDEEDQLLRQQAQQARAVQQAQQQQLQQAQQQAQQAQQQIQQQQQQRRRLPPQAQQPAPQQPLPAHIARQHARLTRIRPAPFFNPQATHEQLMRNMFPSSPMSLPPFMSPTMHHPVHHFHHLMPPNQMDFDDDDDENTVLQHHQMMPFFGDGNMSYEQLQHLSDVMGHVNKGASTEQIDNTSVKFTIKDVAKEIPKDQTDCAICLCAFENGETARRLHCFHVYHAECVEKWLKTNSTCPVCKTDIKETK